MALVKSKLTSPANKFAPLTKTSKERLILRVQEQNKTCNELLNRIKVMEMAIVNEGVKVSKSFNDDIISIMGTVGKESFSIHAVVLVITEKSTWS